MRKKFSLFALTAAFALLFGSCVKDSYRHQVQVFYPSTHRYIYADRTIDSLVFLTFDSYRYYPDRDNSDNFISIDPEMDHKEIPNYYNQGWFITLPVYFKQNATDKIRHGYVCINSYAEGFNETVYASYYQVNWHNVLRPDGLPIYGKNSEMIGCTHTLLAKAEQETDTIKFIAYDSWELTSENPEILTLVKSDSKGTSDVTSLTGRRSARIGYDASTVSDKLAEIKVPIKFQKNESINDTVRATITLKTIPQDNSEGPKTTIQFKQVPKKI